MAFTGTTTDSYVTVMSWITRDTPIKTITVTNTGLSNYMDYKILQYAGPNSSPLITEQTDLPPDTGDINLIVSPLFKVQVQVKSSTSGAATTYEVDVKT